MKNFTEVDADLNLWNSVMIRKNVGCREDYNWKHVWELLQNMNNFEEIE